MRLRSVPAHLLLSVCALGCFLLVWTAEVGLAQGSDGFEEGLSKDLAAVRPGEHIKRLASFQSRYTGYPGCEEAGKYVLEQYKAMGLANISRAPFQMIVPVEKGQASAMHVGDPAQKITIYCVRPNYVRTPKTTETGLSGKLIWAGDGNIEEFNGKQVMGSIVLMNFNTATRWLNAAKLGAKAIIFVEPLHAFRTDAEQKYTAVPVPVPRYYLERKRLPALAAALTGRSAQQFNPQQAMALIQGLGLEEEASAFKETGATIFADMTWEERTVYTVSGEIPGTDPELCKQTLVCHAFYDSTSVVPALAPGAESACGIAAQLEIAEFLMAHPPRRTVKFLATPGHFQALAGVRDYAFKRIHSRRKQVTGDEKKARAGEPHFFIGLDLSSRQNSMAGFYKGHFYDQYAQNEIKLQRIFSDYSGVLLRWAEQLAVHEPPMERARFQSGIVPQHGRDWRSLLPDLFAFDSEVITISGRPAITLATTGDPRNAVNTPLDTYAGLEPYLGNVRAQARLCAYLIKQTADLPVIPLGKDLDLQQVGTIMGRAIEQTLSSYVPMVNVPDVVVSTNLSGTKSMMGVRGRCFVRSDVLGLFQVTGLKMGGDVLVHGFVLSPSSGAIQSVAKPGLVRPSEWKRQEWELRRTDLRLNLFDSVSTTVFDLMDPLNQRLLSNSQVLRGESNSGVQDLVSFPGAHISGTSYSEPVAVYFTKPDKHLKFLLSGGAAGNDGLLLNVEVEAVEEGLSSRTTSGKHLSAKEKKDEEQLYQGKGFLADASENFIYLTAFQIAKDMHLLDSYRLRILKRTAIYKKNVWDLHDLAGAQLLGAQEAMERKQWDLHYRRARMAWALENRVYPDVRGTAHDVVRGVIFYFALLLPFVIFAERLLMNYVDIRKKLAAIVGLFVLSYVVLRFVHPAFQLSKTPIIVLDGFLMLVASVWTICYLILKFQTVMEHIKRHIQTIHRADVARASAAMAAFILGISNMRKRKVRTILTAITLILLTFTVLSFTSFETIPARLLRYASNRPAPYEGLLVRRLTWGPISEFESYDVLNHLRTEGLVAAPRSWFVNRTPTEELKLEVTRVSESGTQMRAVASAMLGLCPQESNFSAVEDYVTHGKWFSSSMKDWPFVCILPSAMTESLRLEAEDVGRVQVSVLGRQLTVVGYLDTKKKMLAPHLSADREGEPAMRTFFEREDLDGEPITPVDFVESAFKEVAGGGEGPALTATGEIDPEDFVSADDQAEEESLYIHMDPDRVLIVPNELCLKLGGTLRSIAAGPLAGGAGRIATRSFLHSLTQFASRLNMALYAGIDGFINRVATRSRLSVGGVQGLLVPISIAALIVFNTMLGAVYERVTEIKVYASVGLAPIHIAALFFAESAVFAVVGAMMGYLLGQIVSFCLIQWLPWLMEGISLNYSSVSAVWSAVLIILVVLGSTAYPARMAGKLSVPDETRKMVLAKPTTDVWEIRFPFTVSSKESLGVMAYLRQYFESNDEDSVGAFTADNIEFLLEQKEGLESIVLQSDVWVAPLDMGISQSVRIASVPDPEEPEITYLFFTIIRKSGEFATWHRMNLGFLKDLRKQLLIWRLVTPEEKERLAGEGQALLAGERSRQT